MTYVEKMANKIRAHIFEGINENIPDIINQIIADTKKACLDSIETFSRFTHMHHSAYVEAIEEAKIKEWKES